MFNEPDTRQTEKPTEMPGPPPVRIATYATYPEAQAAVDSLSDDGFPVETVTIVWRNLRRVEHVMGRRTVVTAGLQGLVSGAWFGTFIGLLFSLFADSTTNTIGLVLAYLVVGALAGAAWQAMGHALQRGQRDFSSIPSLDAETYELWVTPDMAATATTTLGIRSTPRPMDPDAS